MLDPGYWRNNDEWRRLAKKFVKGRRPKRQSSAISHWIMRRFPKEFDVLDLVLLVLCLVPKIAGEAARVPGVFLGLDMLLHLVNDFFQPFESVLLQVS
jgi:hypothetical protein